MRDSKNKNVLISSEEVLRTANNKWELMSGLKLEELYFSDDGECLNSDIVKVIMAKDQLSGICDVAKDQLFKIEYLEEDIFNVSSVKFYDSVHDGNIEPVIPISSDDLLDKIISNEKQFTSLNHFHVFTDKGEPITGMRFDINGGKLIMETNRK